MGQDCNHLVCKAHDHCLVEELSDELAVLVDAYEPCAPGGDACVLFRIVSLIRLLAGVCLIKSLSVRTPDTENEQ